MPGNHDRFSGYNNLPGGTQFESTFGADWDASQEIMTGDSSRVKAAVFAKEDHHLAFCCADFTLRAASDASGVAYGYLSQGFAYLGVISDLVHQTRDLQSRYENCAVIWAIHYPPEFPNCSRRMSLLNSGDVSIAAARCGVNVVLAGHNHQRANYSTQSAPSVRVFATGTPSSVENRGEHSFYEFEFVTVGTSIVGVRAEDVVFNADDDLFETKSRQSLTYAPRSSSWKVLP